MCFFSNIRTTMLMMSTPGRFLLCWLSEQLSASSHNTPSSWGNKPGAATSVWLKLLPLFISPTRPHLCHSFVSFAFTTSSSLLVSFTSLLSTHFCPLSLTQQPICDSRRRRSAKPIHRSIKVETSQWKQLWITVCFSFAVIYVYVRQCIMCVQPHTGQFFKFM